MDEKTKSKPTTPKPEPKSEPKSTPGAKPEPEPVAVAAPKPKYDLNAAITANWQKVTLHFDSRELAEVCVYELQKAGNRASIEEASVVAGGRGIWRVMAWRG